MLGSYHHGGGIRLIRIPANPIRNETRKIRVDLQETRSKSAVKKKSSGLPGQEKNDMDT